MFITRWWLWCYLKIFQVWVWVFSYVAYHVFSFFSFFFFYDKYIINCFQMFFFFSCSSSLLFQVFLPSSLSDTTHTTLLLEYVTSGISSSLCTLNNFLDNCLAWKSTHRSPDLLKVYLGKSIVTDVTNWRVLWQELSYSWNCITYQVFKFCCYICPRAHGNIVNLTSAVCLLLCGVVEVAWLALQKLDMQKINRTLYVT